MRTFKDIYIDYCNWLVLKTGNESYSYEAILDSFEDENTAKAFLYRSILEKCYDKKDGLYYFCKFVIGDLKDIGYPKAFRFNKLLRTWDKLVRENKKLCIMSARGHGKSVFFSEIENLFDMFKAKFKRIILISASQEQANRILNELKTIVDNNEWLLTKKTINRWATETIGYNNGYIIVKGIGSEILGEHVDRIVIDDILRSDNKISDIQIEDYIDMTLSPMLLNRNGQMIIVGTPKSEVDIFTTIRKRVKEGSVWKIGSFPAILSYEKKILQCPDRFSWETIMDKRLEMGPLKFAREYQLEFFSRDTSLFPKKYIDHAKFLGKEMSLLNKIDKRDPNWTFVAGVDVARSGAVSADFTVVIILAFNSITQQKQIVYFWRSKGLMITEQAKRMAETDAAFDHPLFLVEQNNFGQDMIDDLVNNHNIFVETFTTGSVGQKKEELIRFLITAFEHEQIVMPRADEFSRDKMDILEEELAKFCIGYTPAGNEKFEGVGAHDDCVIALALANKATQDAGVPFAVSNFAENEQEGTHPEYGAFITNAKGESDLVQLIKMGIIK